MNRIIRIGTRDSQLALWQAKYVEQLISSKGIKTELVLMKSEGDVNLVSPLYEMGIQGIFTKTLDAALINDKIDIAVHSLKDVPTQLPENLILTAVPERGNYSDVLIYKSKEILNSIQATIATSSLRRKAQWLNKYPHHHIESLRGNINTRLKKLNENTNWDAAVFAQAGIDRINLNVPNSEELSWMLPAPAQGALAIVCRQTDLEVQSISNSLNHAITLICVQIERKFLRALMGGCSMPIGALAIYENNLIKFKGNILTLDGKEKSEIEVEFNENQFFNAGEIAANLLLKQGGGEILKKIKLGQ